MVTTHARAIDCQLCVLTGEDSPVTTNHILVTANECPLIANCFLGNRQLFSVTGHPPLVTGTIYGHEMLGLGQDHWAVSHAGLTLHPPPADEAFFMTSVGSPCAVRQAGGG